MPEEYVRLLSELPHYDPETGTFLDPEEGEDLGGEGPVDEEGEGEGEDGEGGVGVGVEEDEDATPLASAGPGGGGGVKGKEREWETRVDTPEAYELDAGVMLLRRRSSRGGDACVALPAAWTMSPLRATLL